MRQLILLTALSQINPSTAQSYTSFPTSNAIWVDQSYSYPDGFTGYFDPEHLVSIDNYCLNGVDTIISGNTYTQLMFCEGIYKGAIRDNGGQVYYVPEDSLEEYLLYDFTVSVGDIIPYPLATWEFYDTLYVQSIDSVLISGNYRTIVNLQNCPDPWIEGFGCVAGLLAQPFYNNNVSGGYWRMGCFSLDGTIYRPDSYFMLSESGTCTLNYLQSETSEKILNSFIYPNPGHTDFFLEFETALTSEDIHLINQLGEAVSFRFQNYGNRYLLSLDDLPAGIYYVLIHTNEGEFSNKIVKE